MVVRRKKARKWKRIGAIFLATAVIILLYPLMTDFYAWYEQKMVNPVVSEDGEYPGRDSGRADKPASEAGFDLDRFLLEIPAIELSTPVITGTSREQLMKAPGWYEMSALPGEGNTAIAGHRTTYGGPFRHVSQLQPGDKIFLTYQGKVYVYQVEKVFTIKSTDWSVIDPCGYPALTLTTCHPEGRSKRRAVRAKLLNQDEPGLIKSASDLKT